MTARAEAEMDSPVGMRRDGGCAIDLVHLSRQTLGDRSLETELLRLFQRQCSQILRRLEALETSRDAGARRDLAHTLKGSARAVGAVAIADAAERCEAVAVAEDEAALRAAFETLKDACARTGADVARLLASA
jgi:HPt (histidine-containing phosphotransfer) domain-containing protein